MKLTKTTALKASLLLVLAANVSWDQLDFGSTELASSETVKAGTAPAASASAAAPTSKSGEGATVKLAAHAETAVSIKTQAREYKDEDPFMVCGDRYEVVFRQNDFTDGGKTTVTATKVSDATDGIAIVLNSNMDSTLAKKASSLETLKHLIKVRRAENKISCSGEAVASKTAIKTPEEIAKDADLKKQMHECKVDKKGQDLKGDEITICLNNELDRVQDRVPARGEDGKLVSDKKRNADILADAKALTKRLKDRFRKALLSKDESQVEDAQEEVEKAIASLDKLKDTYADEDDDRDDESRSSRHRSTRDTSRKSSRTKPNPYDKMIAELSALSKAADTRLEAMDLKDRGQEITKNLQDGFRTASMHPSDQQALNDYTQAKMEYIKFQYDIQNGFVRTDLQELSQLKKSGALSAIDYSDFIRPYTELQTLMKQSVLTPTSRSYQNFSGPITSSTLGVDVPTNLASQRTTLSNNSSSVLGSPLPSVAPASAAINSSSAVRPPVPMNRSF